MTSFTPGPWRVGKKYTASVYAGNMQGIRVAACFDDDGEANAAHIVKCVNSHDDLLAALKMCLSYIETEDMRTLDLRKARAAIAKATA